MNHLVRPAPSPTGDQAGKAPRIKPVALVTGAAGLIGSYLLRTAPRWAPAWQVHGLTRQDVELTDIAHVREVWRALHPDVVIHCAAVSRTFQCERDPTLARKVNVEVTAFLADLAADIPFVLLSSDQVFDGLKGWYAESDAVNPVNIYAETKVAAERLVLANPKHMVIRTSLNAGRSLAEDRAFNEEMLRAWQANQPLTLFTDEFRSPIPAGVTARAVWELVAVNRPGLYHLAGSERLSRWEIGQLLAARWSELEPKMVARSIRDYSGPRRPPDLSLRCDKVQRLLSFTLPGLQTWLAEQPIGGTQDIWDFPAS